MTDLNEKYHNLIQAVEAERKSEQTFFQNLSFQKSNAQKKEAGILLSPVIINKSYYTVGEFVEIEVDRPENQHTGFFHSGKGCIISSRKSEESYHGTISYQNRRVIRILIKQDLIEKSHLLNDKSIEIELTYDDRPFAMMINTLRKVIQTTNPLHQFWKKTISGNHQSESNYKKNVSLSFQTFLNKEQKIAIEGMVLADNMGVIHGPPGTGKTTTIVHLCQQLTVYNEKILVCAPSNNAVDLLVKKINEVGLKVLRVGNLTRMNDQILHLSIEEKLRNHPEWKRIKKVKIEALQIKKEAQAFKRNFGPEEKRNRKNLLSEARQLRKWARDLEKRLEDEIIREAEIICTTLMGASLPILNQTRFSTLVIDEASQATEPECWIPMLLSEKVIFVGDHKQLPPTIRSTKGLELGLGVTILDQLSDRFHNSYLLKCQYRMNDQILSFSNKHFYEDQLYGAESIKNHSLPNDSKPLIFIDTAGCDFAEEPNLDSKSLKNSGEYFILREHMLKIKEMLYGHTIGIISPYADQVKYIRSEWEGESEFENIQVEIDTIDGFQGQEKDVVYISLVRSNDLQQIGFLSDLRRLNVALTRAKKKLIIIGDSATLGSHKIYLDLVNHCENYGSYKSAWEYLSFT